jgi:release factor glutamine methyltransferase
MLDSTDVVELLQLAADLPQHESVRLLMAATQRTRSEVLQGGKVEAAEVVRYRSLVAQRRRGVPLQYLEGTVQFGPVEMLIDTRALIPRPETEQLWELVTNRYRGAPEVVVDLCCGSGNLALALKHRWPAAQVIAVDTSPDAVALARENVRFTGLHVEVLAGDLFAPLPADLVGKVDILVANPPYLSQDELATLPVEVRDHEPHAALVAGSAGDEVLRRIAAGAPSWMRAGGLVACEISEFRTDRIEQAFGDLGGVIFPDLTGRSRFVVAQFR